MKSSFPLFRLICRVALLASLALAGSLVRAQPSATGVIAGRVLDVVRGRYLNEARVTVDGTTAEALTDDLGQYRIGGIAAGPVTVRVFYTGLVSQSVAVVVVAGQTSTQNFSLTGAAENKPGVPEVVKLSSYTVYADRDATGSALASNQQRFAPNIETVVDAGAYGSVPDGSVGEFLKMLPGVTAIYTANEITQVTLRGLPSSSTPVSQDGNRMASPVTGDALTRTFILNRVNLNSISRIEVTKTPTPDIPADTFGGSVNFISKNAFELNHPILDFSTSAGANSKALTFEQRPGPGEGTHEQVRPAADFTYINPVSNNFGFTLTGQYSDAFTPENRETLGWLPTSGSSALAPASNPFMSKIGLLDGPKTTKRNSFSAGFDFRITPKDVLNLKIERNSYEEFFTQQSPSFSTIGSASVAPLAYDPTFTESAVGAGQVATDTSYRDHVGNTVNLTLGYHHTGEIWTIEGGAFNSHGHETYRDIDNGFFNDVSTRLNSLDMTLAGIDKLGPRSITTTATAGTVGVTPGAVDWRNAGNYVLNSGNSTPTTTSDTVRGAHLNLSRSFEVKVPIKLKLGADVRQEDRDLRDPSRTFTFVGPDGKANTADDLIKNYDLIDPTMSQQNVPFYAHSFYGAAQWVDPYKVWQLYQAHPAYWTDNLTTDANNAASTSKVIVETVSSAYLRADTHLFSNRLWLVGGVRYEETRDNGFGMLRQSAATTAVDRGAHIVNQYGNFYPSANGTFNLTDELLVRVGYSRTIARPDFSNIVPGTTIGLPTATPPTITVNNPDLKPWTANNYDASIEYYFPTSGVVSIGGFRKDISNFFGATLTPATPALLAANGLDSTYADQGYFVSETTNVGAARVTGFEFNYSQDLKFLPQLFQGFGLFFNITRQRLEGSNIAIFTEFVPRNIGTGLNYNRGKFTGNVNWNFRGEQRLTAFTGTNVPAGAYQYDMPRTIMGVDLEYRFIPHLSLFVNVRNLLDDPRDREAFGPNAPAYARQLFQQEFGAQCYAGIRGAF